MKNIFVLLIAVFLMNAGNVFGQTDTTINGVIYTLFSPGLWVEVGPYPSDYIHCGDPTEVVEVTSATGRVWMDRNLGASQVAFSSTDNNSYGDLYQWGRGADGHQCRNSPTTGTLSSIDQPEHGNFIIVFSSPVDWRSPQNTNLWQGVNGVNNPCPASFRIPSEAELNAERMSWVSNNHLGAFASPLKLPMAGFRSSTGGFVNVGIFGGYWSNTVNGTSSQILRFFDSFASMHTFERAVGVSVRCIKD